MVQRKIEEQSLQEYRLHLEAKEKVRGTVEKYMRDLISLRCWLDDRDVTHDAVLRWKEQLLSQGYASVTINSMLVAVNGFFSFMGWEDCRVRLLRIQRRGFREQSRELTQQDYRQLVTTAANQGKERTALLLETITATGIRASEVDTSPWKL